MPPAPHIASSMVNSTLQKPSHPRLCSCASLTEAAQLDRLRPLLVSHWSYKALTQRQDGAYEK